MNIEVGQIWCRRQPSGSIIVRHVLSVGERIEYEVLHAPKGQMRKPNNRLGRCRPSRFLESSEQIEEMDDYSVLAGAKKFRTWLTLTTSGEPLFRCSDHRKEFYLRKGYCRQIDEDTIQFLNDVTEDRLKELGKPAGFDQFFMAVKNDKCVCCGRGDRLTRHHVIPKRHKKKVPLPWRHCLSNILFVCIECHKLYENTPEPEPPIDDWQGYVRAWRDHFLEVLKPKHMPAGWDIISVKNMDAVRGRI